ncbi:MAG TPA: tetratricopeptide repeat protein [Bacteroidia bacterium]|nr:tetratricopeptide repeat protein [Bacteroidia bacterium]
MKKLKSLFLSLMLINYGFAQVPPQIKTLLKEVKEASYYDSAKLYTAGESTIKKATASNVKGVEAEVHLYYGNYFVYTRNLKKAQFYFEKSLAEAKKYNVANIKMLAQIRLSFLKYENESSKDEAEKELLSLLDSTKKNNDYENTAELLNLIGIIKEDKNQSKEAAKLYLEGSNLAETHNLNYYIAVFQNNLGLIKYYSEDYKGALTDFQKALPIAEKENNKRLASHIQMNLCLANISNKNETEAHKMFEKAIEYSKTNNLPIELASSYINLGSAYINSNKSNEALVYIDSAIALLQKHNLVDELTKAYIGKVEIFIKLKNITKAEDALVNAEKLVKKTGNLRDLSSCYLMQYQIKLANNNYKEALSNYLIYSKLKDSLQNQIDNKVIQELQLSYKIQKKENELEKERSKSLSLEASNQEERFLKWLAIGSGLFFLTVILAISFLIYNRKIREKQDEFSKQLIQSIEEERHRIARDLHDDIGQSLSILKSKTSKENSDKLEIKEELERIIEQTREISNNLYPSHLEKIGLVRSIAGLIENIQSSVGIECSFNIAPDVENLSSSTKTHLFRIIQECTNNTIKHANASALKVSIDSKKDGFIYTYIDNGQGTNKQKSNIGLGLNSIRERAKILNGSLQIDDKLAKGFKLIIEFKNS